MVESWINPCRAAEVNLEAVPGPLQSFGGQFRGCSWARAVQASSAASDFACSSTGPPQSHRNTSSV
eukprot:10397521-Alexandrium_andersonii.AAC.1